MTWKYVKYDLALSLLLDPVVLLDGYGYERHMLN